MADQKPSVDRAYHGVRHGLGTARVTFYDQGIHSLSHPLPPRNDLRNHSPDGFEWGYAGSGPAQLALALLANAFGDDETALRHYQAFKAGVIARLTADDWVMTAGEIRETVKRFDGVTIR